MYEKTPAIILELSQAGLLGLSSVFVEILVIILELSLSFLPHLKSKYCCLQQGWKLENPLHYRRDQDSRRVPLLRPSSVEERRERGDDDTDTPTRYAREESLEWSTFL